MLSLFGRKKRMEILMPPLTMSFGDFVTMADIFKSDAIAASGARGAVAREDSFWLETWILENWWRMKKEQRIPEEIQRRYNEALKEFNRER